MSVKMPELAGCASHASRNTRTGAVAAVVSR